MSPISDTSSPIRVETFSHKVANDPLNGEKATDEQVGDEPVVKTPQRQIPGERCPGGDSAVQRKKKHHATVTRRV